MPSWCWNKPKFRRAFVNRPYNWSKGKLEVPWCRARASAREKIISAALPRKKIGLNELWCCEICLQKGQKPRVISFANHKRGRESNEPIRWMQSRHYQFCSHFRGWLHKRCTHKQTQYVFIINPFFVPSVSTKTLINNNKSIRLRTYVAWAYASQETKLPHYLINKRSNDY